VNKPTIADAKRIAERVRARGVIVLAFDEDAFCGASYGETKHECRQIGRLLDRIVRQIESEELEVWDDRYGDRPFPPTAKDESAARDEGGMA
jgi:hypothetical protein